MLVALAHKGARARVLATPSEFVPAVAAETVSSNPQIVHLGRLMIRCLLLLLMPLILL